MPAVIDRLYSAVVVETTIDAPPSTVYDVLSDPRTYPDWLVGAARTRRVDPTFPAPGTEFDHSVGAGGPLTVDDSTEAVDAEEDRRLSLIVHAGFFHARVDFELRPNADGGTELCFAEKPLGVAAAVTPLLRPALHGRNVESMRRLRQRVEPAAAPG